MKGDFIMNCPTCEGNGEMPCTCHLGKKSNHPHCDHCHDSGIVDCSRCNGTGLLD